MNIQQPVPVKHHTISQQHDNSAPNILLVTTRATPLRSPCRTVPANDRTVLPTQFPVRLSRKTPALYLDQRQVLKNKRKKRAKKDIVSVLPTVNALVRLRRRQEIFQPSGDLSLRKVGYGC